MTTVVIPTFNSEGSVGATLESIRTQNVKVEKILIIDAGSSDRTAEIANQFLGSQDKFIVGRDEGPYDAMIKGIKLAESELVAILNSDDQWFPGTLEVVERTFRQFPTVGIVHGNVEYVMPDRSTFKIVPTSGFWRWLGLGLPSSHPATFVRRQVYEKVGYFDFKNFPICADQDFVYRALQEGISDLHIDVNLTRMYAGGLSSSKNLRTEIDSLMENRGRIRRLVSNIVRIVLDRDDAYYNGQISVGFGERIRNEFTSVSSIRRHRREILREIAHVLK